MKRKFSQNTVIQALKSVLPRDRSVIVLHEPLFKGNEWSYVKSCLDRGWVSSAGEYVGRFEKQLAEYTGVRHAVAVANGTAALHICLKIAGVSADDEVLIPALTFVATANAVSYCGAVPHFVDSGENTLGLDPYKLSGYLDKIAVLRSGGCFNRKSGRRIRAVVPVHAFGHPVDIDPLVEVCKKFRLQLIEDAAESLGSRYKGRHTGCWGILAATSFNGNKIVTTGGGGAVLTNNESLARLAGHLTTQAKLPHKWAFNHDLPGYNYRMPNINAALGCAQLEQLPEFVSRKRDLAARYLDAFADIPGVSVFREASFACSNYWLNNLLLDEKYCAERDNLLESVHREGIMARPAWTLLHRLPMYRGCPRMDLSGAESLERRIISIPSSAFI